MHHEAKVFAELFSKSDSPKGKKFFTPPFVENSTLPR
jgi:hypothetical protein